MGSPTAALINSFAKSDLPAPALPVHNTEALPLGATKTFQIYWAFSKILP